MDEMHVFPHGDRWAVAESLDVPPGSEFATREEAESAARARVSDLAGVIVHDTDPTGLAQDGHDDRREPAPEPKVEADEWERGPQAGL